MTLEEFFRTAPKGASFNADSTLGLGWPMTLYVVSLGNGKAISFDDDGGIHDVEFHPNANYFLEGFEDDLEESSDSLRNAKVEEYRSPMQTKTMIEELLFEEEADDPSDYGDLDRYILQAYEDLKQYVPEVLSEKVKKLFEMHAKEIEEMNSSALESMKKDPIGTTVIGVEGPHYGAAEKIIVKTGEDDYLLIDNNGYIVTERKGNNWLFDPSYKNTYIKKFSTPAEAISIVEKTLSEAREQYKPKLEDLLKRLKSI